MSRTFFPLLVAGAGLALLAACQSSGINDQDAFLADVLTCPAEGRLPQNRTPSCEVPPEALIALGDEACIWLQDQPMAHAKPASQPYWKDPYDVFNVASQFARQERTTAAVPLEDGEQGHVAYFAWRHLCRDLESRYNYNVHEYSD